MHSTSTLRVDVQAIHGLKPSRSSVSLTFLISKNFATARTTALASRLLTRRKECLDLWILSVISFRASGRQAGSQHITYRVDQEKPAMRSRRSDPSLAARSAA